MFLDGTGEVRRQADYAGSPQEGTRVDFRKRHIPLIVYLSEAEDVVADVAGPHATALASLARFHIHAQSTLDSRVAAWTSTVADVPGLLTALLLRVSSASAALTCLRGGPDGEDVALARLP